jgi:hypothetical protein
VNEGDTLDLLAGIIRDRYDECPPNRYPTEYALAQHLITELRAAGYTLTPPWRRRGLEPVDFAACGSEAQAASHRRRGEKPCAACKAAETRARSERKRRQRQREQVAA